MHGTMIRDRRWKLSHYPVTGKGELYDLWHEESMAGKKRRMLRKLELRISAAEFHHVPPGGETLPPGGFRLDNRQITVS